MADIDRRKFLMGTTAVAAAAVLPAAKQANLSFFVKVGLEAYNGMGFPTMIYESPPCRHFSTPSNVNDMARRFMAEKARRCIERDWEPSNG